MPSTATREPGPDHPITIAPTSGRVTVRAGGALVAQSDRALTLSEANYPPVQYIPRDDVDLSRLARTDTASHCPYKGDAGYYALADGGRDIAWTYDEASPAVAAIAGHLAFYPDRVDSLSVGD